MARLLQYKPYVSAKKNNAGKKAPRDICQILKRCGFEYLCDASSPSRIIRTIRRLMAMSRLKKGDVLIMQFPTSKLWCSYFSIFKPAKTVGIIHDLDSMRASRTNKHGGGHTY